MPLYGTHTIVSPNVAKKVVLPTNLDWCPAHIMEHLKKPINSPGDKSPNSESAMILAKLKYLPEPVQMSAANAIMDLATDDVWKDTGFAPYIYSRQHKQHLRNMLDRLDLKNKDQENPQQLFVCMKDLREGCCGGLQILECLSEELSLKYVSANLHVLAQDGPKGHPIHIEEDCMCFDGKVPETPDTVSDEELDEDDEDEAERPRKRMRLSTYPKKTPILSDWTLKDIRTRLATYNNLVIWARTELAIPRVRDNNDRNLQVAHWLMTKICHLSLPDRVKAAYHLMDIIPDDWRALPVYKDLKYLTDTWSRMELPVHMEKWLADEFCILNMVDGKSFDHVFNPDFNPPIVSKFQITKASDTMVREMLLLPSTNKVIARDFFHCLCENFSYGIWLDSTAFQILRYYCNPYTPDSIFLARDYLVTDGRWTVEFPSHSDYHDNQRRCYLGIIKIAKRIGMTPYLTHQAIARVVDFMNSDELTKGMADLDYGVAAIMMTFHPRCTTDDFWAFLEILQPGWYKRPQPGSPDEDRMMDAIRRVRRIPAFHITAYDMMMWIARGLPKSTPTELRKEIETAVLVLHIVQMHNCFSEICLVKLASSCLALGLIQDLQGKDACNPFCPSHKDDGALFSDNAICTTLIDPAKERWSHHMIEFKQFESTLFEILQDIFNLLSLSDTEVDLLECLLGDWENSIFEDLANATQETVVIRHEDTMLAILGDRPIEPTLTPAKVPYLPNFTRKMFQEKFCHVRPPSWKKNFVSHKYSARYFCHL